MYTIANVIATNSCFCSWGYAAAVPASFGPYKSPMDDAYRYYALQNQLAGTGPRESNSFC